MAAPKRAKLQIPRDRLEIAELYLKGHTQAAIAVQKGMTREMVSYDLKAITASWVKESVLALDAAKARELEKVNLLELTYWDAWEHSKLPRKRTATQTTKGDDKATTSAGIITQERDGNPAFLAGVMTCIEKRCRILGLDAPTKIAPTDPTGEREYGNLSDADLLQRVAKLVDAGRTPGGG